MKVERSHIVVLVVTSLVIVTINAWYRVKAAGRIAQRAAEEDALRDAGREAQ